MEPTAAVDKARKVIDSLPKNASWDDLMYELYVRGKIENGLKAAEEGRTISHAELKKRLSVHAH
ncbi:MAG TPA: hypothetical protein PLV42_09690 [bacterium]|nr:hypothetical protein [bacterium]